MVPAAPAGVEAARLQGGTDHVGRVAAGLDADLVAVDGDPLTDLRSLADPALVLSRGRLVRAGGRP